MARRVILAHQVLPDLDNIWTYLADQGSPETASRYVGEILDEIDNTLSQFPGVGHTRDDVSDKKYRFWRVKSHIVVYRFDDEAVFVARVVHGQRDFRRLFP